MFHPFKKIQIVPKISDYRFTESKASPKIYFTKKRTPKRYANFFLNNPAHVHISFIHLYF